MQFATPALRKHVDGTLPGLVLFRIRPPRCEWLYTKPGLSPLLQISPLASKCLRVPWLAMCNNKDAYAGIHLPAPRIKATPKKPHNDVSKQTGTGRREWVLSLPLLVIVVACQATYQGYRARSPCRSFVGRRGHPRLWHRPKGETPGAASGWFAHLLRHRGEPVGQAVFV